MDNPRRLCAYYNRVRGNRSREYLLARLSEPGIAS